MSEYKYIDTGLWKVMLGALTTSDIEDLLQSYETDNKKNIADEQAQFVYEHLKELNHEVDHEITHSDMIQYYCRCGKQFYEYSKYLEHKKELIKK